MTTAGALAEHLRRAAPLLERTPRIEGPAATHSYATLWRWYAEELPRVPELALVSAAIAWLVLLADRRWGPTARTLVPRLVHQDLPFTVADVATMFDVVDGYRGPVAVQAAALPVTAAVRLQQAGADIGPLAGRLDRARRQLDRTPGMPTARRRLRQSLCELRALRSAAAVAR